MRAGASDFLAAGRPERLLEALVANSDRRRAAGELAPVSEKLAPELSLEQLVGAAPDFRAALAVAAKAARNRLPILIIGEPGTGKETFARAIHAAKPARPRPDGEGRLQGGRRQHHRQRIVRPCNRRLPRRLRREDRAHRRGRWRHAAARRDRRAAGETQAALDRVLATGEVGRSGATAAIRSMSGWSRRRAGRCPRTSTPGSPSGSARPASRCRHCASAASDIPALARHLLARFPSSAASSPLSIGNDALAVLMRYGWPGNVRQLAGVLFRAGLQCDGSSLTAEDFPHIAIQSRFSGRRNDFAPEISQSRATKR